MPSLIMERKRKILQSILEDGNTIDLTNSSHFCFSCEQIFANQKCLEEHVCPLASFICSCGTEFTEYKDMLEHSTTHEPGHQVLDHKTIKKRRIEKYREEEEKLKRLQEGEVVWNAPNDGIAPSISKPQVPNTSGLASRVPRQAAPIPQVPGLHSNPLPQVAGVQNIFADVGAPTVDLWMLYQPVVLLQTMQNFKKTKPYTCGKCEQGFMSKVALVSHYSLHVTDKVSGCIGCGLLLSSKKLVPRFHNCNSNSPTKYRLITAKPLSYKPRSGVGAKKNQPSRPPQVASTQQLENQNPSMTGKRSRPLQAASAAKKNQNIRTYNNNANRVPKISAPLQLKSQNPTASKPNSAVSMAAKSPNISAFSPVSQKARVSPAVVQKTPEDPASQSAQNSFTCRVCHLPFESAQRLQRHKCVKAQEFMAKHMSAKRDYKIVKVAPSAPQVNGERKLGFSSSDSTKKPQHTAVSLDKGKASAPVNGGAGGESDDDCFIVESGPEKPAEVIYQVTSSVPIKS